MKNIKHKKVMLPVLGIAILGGTLFGASYVNAQDASLTPSIVQKIADTFHLNQSDVQKVFDDERQARRTDMQAKFEAKLTQAVSDGKITTAQKDAIVKKFQDMAADKPDLTAFKSMTPSERKAAMDSKKQDLQTWASQNGLTLQTLQDVLGRGGFGFHGGFGRRMMK